MHPSEDGFLLSIFHKLLERLRPVSHYDRYRRDGYDDLITADLGLTEASHVVEVGGYLGDWSSRIVDLYNCNIQIFEPVPEYFEFLKEKFLGMENVKIYNFGLSASNKAMLFGKNGPATGRSSSGEAIQVNLRSVHEISNILPRVIDLIAINIEGGEYELIPELFKSKLINRCNSLFIQFHLLDYDSKNQHKNCRNLLLRTHEMAWSYDFVWEAWHRQKARITS